MKQSSEPRSPSSTSGGWPPATAGHPARESELATDDKDWPWWSISQLAVSGLAAGREHLGAVRDHLERSEPYPFADGTLLRTAMLGAATAVWMLTPDDRATRLKRARTVAAEVYDKHAQFLADLSTLSGGSHPDTQLVKEHVSKRAAQLQELRDAAGERATFNATHVIEEAVKAGVGEQFGLEAKIEWRRGSGAAHGLPLVAARGHLNDAAGEQRGRDGDVPGGGRLESGREQLSGRLPPPASGVGTDEPTRQRARVTPRTVGHSKPGHHLARLHAECQVSRWDVQTPDE
jgi:hypothetical protein